MRPVDQTEYIVQCIRESAAMCEEDARAFLAEHDAHVRAEALAEASVGSYTTAAVPAGSADTARRAHLLHTMTTQGGRWKSGAVARWYTERGYSGLGVRAARQDLAVLRDAGAVVQHDERGVRWFTAVRGGGRA